jgi:hypothetical protein
MRNLARTTTTAPKASTTMTDTSNGKRAGNPYGGVPSGGITLPPYYRPTPDLVSNNLYYPGQEELGPDEMRISFIGSTPIPVTGPSRHVHHGRAR